MRGSDATLCRITLDTCCCRCWLQVHLRQNPTHTAAPVLNEDGSVPMDGSGDFDVISRRGRPRGPRAPRRLARPRISRPDVVAPLPQPPAPPALSLSNPVQYADNARGPPALVSAFPDEPRRVDAAMFPPLPLPAFGDIAAAAAERALRAGNPFQTGPPAAGFHRLRADDAAGRGDDGSALSPSLYLSAAVRRTAQEDADARRCRSYSPATVDQRQVRSAVASAVQPAAGVDDYGAVAVVSPPMPEPERATCGDLPLDLTAKSATGDEPRPEVVGSPADDDVTAYRPRRHYESWKLQGLRPRSGGEPPESRSDSDVDVKREEVGVACARPEPEVERPAIGEPTETDAPAVKRARPSTDDEGRASSSEVATGSPASGTDLLVGAGRYQCVHCEIEFFGSRVLHAMHMAFHGPVDDPFQCSQCGVRTADRVEFFLHLARAAHS